jgi:hypothetical protein
MLVDTCTYGIHCVAKVTLAHIFTTIFAVLLPNSLYHKKYEALKTWETNSLWPRIHIKKWIMVKKINNFRQSTVNLTTHSLCVQVWSIYNESTLRLYNTNSYGNYLQYMEVISFHPI